MGKGRLGVLEKLRKPSSFGNRSTRLVFCPPKLFHALGSARTPPRPSRRARRPALRAAPGAEPVSAPSSPFLRTRSSQSSSLPGVAGEDRGRRTPPPPNTPPRRARRRFLGQRLPPPWRQGQPPPRLQKFSPARPWKQNHFRGCLKAPLTTGRLAAWPKIWFSSSVLGEVMPQVRSF